MILALFNWIASFRPWFMIPNFDGTPYLLRVKLFGSLPREGEEGKREEAEWGGSAYLHRFFSHDLERDLHNHPMEWSWSIVLWGGYTEEYRRKDGTIVTRRLWPFWIRPWACINLLGPHVFHRITKLHGGQTWTLFRCGKKVREWGFLVDGYWIPEPEYVAKKKGLPVPAFKDPIPEWLLNCFDCGALLAPPAATYIRIDPYEPLPVCPKCSYSPNMAKARTAFVSAVENEARGFHAA
jgi:hypothetical protein